MFIAIAAQAAVANLLGYWTNKQESVVVLIAPCEQDAACGTVQWASPKAQADARRGGTPTLIGTVLLHEFVAIEPGRWTGVLFVPDMNRKSRAEIVQVDDDRLRIRGCAVGRLLCKSQLWSRTVAH